VEGSELLLPFEPTRVIENLRFERYVRDRTGTRTSFSLSKRLYYLIRPFLSVPLRRQLQRIYFHAWDRIPFPQWPVDVTVDELVERLLVLFMKAAGIDEMPFIWFWPDGAASAAMMTHDVETAAGLDFCRELMAINESFDISSSFQLVPEDRYTIAPKLLTEIRRRGHEINIHDLNHDGRLFWDRTLFEERIKRVNSYGRAFQAHGFRAGVLYRNLDWFDVLDFEYDMSVPNVGHLEAQRGGCCTVFPYFIGKVLELPVTTTQDHSLFHILGQYSLDVWQAQVSVVMQKHGLASFIVHPDYISEMRCLHTYRALLALLSGCRVEQAMWIATPGEVNKWWRFRSRMKLVYQDKKWEIQGVGKERARVAYARAAGGRIVYRHER
jgi:hypothetical protein